MPELGGVMLPPRPPPPPLKLFPVPPPPTPAAPRAALAFMPLLADEDELAAAVKAANAA